MSTKIQELPEVGEIVIGTISKISDHGAYATLDEYNGIQGFLHISEIAPGWVRSVTKFVRTGEKKVLLVKKINKQRSDVDLSLKQISKDQKKKKLQDVKRFEKEKGILKNIQEKSGLTDNQEIRGILEISNEKSNGVELIKKILLDVLKKNKVNNVNISYLGAPKYRITINSADFKTAEKTLKPILEEIEKLTNKAGGVYKFQREESKKTGEGWLNFQLRKCSFCKIYTLKDTCPQCKEKTNSVHPAKFSPDDKYLKYRIRDKK